MLLSRCSACRFSVFVISLFVFSNPLLAGSKKPKPDPEPEPEPPPVIGVTDLVSIAYDGSAGNGGSYNYSMSADGRFIAFVSRASNLVPNDTNAKEDIFVHDRLTGTVERVSVASDGSEANDWSTAPSISADGRYVVFGSYAENLVDGGPHHYPHIFVHDRINGVTERVSVASDGTAANASSYAPSISADGRFVAYSSLANNLVANDTNATGDIFVHDRLNGTTTRVSVSSSGGQGDRSSRFVRLSADGMIVAFLSDATNLVRGDTNLRSDIFVHDRVTGVTERVSVATDGTQGNDWSGGTAISADGNVVAFSSTASNLVPGDTNNWNDVFVHNRLTGVTERVSVNSSGEQATDESFGPALSADGRYVAFHSFATNLIPNANWWYTDDVYIRDRLTGTTEYISIAADGTQGDSDSYRPSISADGRFVAFTSFSTNLVTNDANGGVADVFVRDRLP